MSDFELLDRDGDNKNQLDFFGVPFVQNNAAIDGYSFFNIRRFPDKEYFHLDLYINNGFSPSQISLLREAVEGLVVYKADWKGIFGYLDGLLEAGIIPTEPRDKNKPFLNSKGESSPLNAAEEKNNLYTSIFVSMTRGGIYKGVLFIDFFDEAPPTQTGASWKTGDALVDQFQNHRELRIRINRTFVDSDLADWNGKSSRLWTGVIGHEVMHNLGWTHDTTPLSNTYISRMTRYFSDFVHSFEIS